MPRKPTTRRRSLLGRPVTFSPFARTVAHLATAYMIKRRMLHNEFNQPPSSSAKGKQLIEGNNLEEERENSESSDEDVSDGVIQADFAFFDPKPDDFHGVKILLHSYIGNNKQWDLSGFVDLILGQTTVGTVVKIEGDEDAGLFAVVSALNLGRYKDHRCIEEIKEFLLKECREKNMTDNLRLLLEERAHDVSLLVSQHVVNLPPQLLPPLYDALFDEVSWAVEDEPTEELRNSFRLKSYILVSRIYKHKNADHKKMQSEEPIIYVKPEDEIFHKLCSWCFSFPLNVEQVTAHELRNYQSMGLVMAIEADKVPTFREQLHSLIDEP